MVTERVPPLEDDELALTGLGLGVMLQSAEGSRLLGRRFGVLSEESLGKGIETSDIGGDGGS